jgi:chromate transporter
MTVDLLHLFLLSVFISLVTFGGGSQALFYEYGVVGNHWITRSDLSAVLAWGYATPGPAVFTTATFIGYHVGGVVGAVIGTVGIFIMPFLSSLLAARYLTNLLRNPHAEYFVRGVGLAAAGLVAATAFGVVQYKHMALWQLAIGLGSLIVSLRWKVNPLFILLVGGIVGLLCSL